MGFRCVGLPSKMNQDEGTGGMGGWGGWEDLRVALVETADALATDSDRHKLCRAVCGTRGLTPRPQLSGV